MKMMKLRLAANSVRLRLSQGDVQKFAKDGTVGEVVDVDRSVGQFVGFRLVKTSGIREMSVNYDNNVLTVTVPPTKADEWTSTDLVGIERPASDGMPSILVEKDFACLHSRPGEDDNDTFPNPKTG